MLVTDPWWSSTTNGFRVEVLVHFGREMTPDIMEWSEIEVLQYLNLTQDTIWKDARDREMKCPFTQAEVRKIQEGQPKEVVARETFWRLRPDGISVLPPVGNKSGVFCILEHKRMSDVCDQYITRAKHTEEDQYLSLHSTISTNMKFFNVSEDNIQSTYSKLVMRVFDVYTNVLKYMYNTRFNGGQTTLEASPEVQPTPIVVNPLIRTMTTFHQIHPDKYKKRKKECQKEV